VVADWCFVGQHHGIHEEMLKDDIRTRSYQRAILQNKHLFKDKIVLDVGAGTAILSLFAAQAGASKVYAVDNSSIADQAKKIVKDNGFSNTIEVIRGKIEEIELPCGPNSVDILISEWMGYFLLYEAMLDSVIIARDKWLKKDTGIMLPDKARMFIAGIEDAQYKEEKFDFWRNVYGFDMSCLREVALAEPLVETVEHSCVMTTPCLLKEFDIQTMQPEEVDFKAVFSIDAVRDDFCHAFVVYFDVEFSRCHKTISFSTGPHATYTHWKQTIFYLKEDLTVLQNENISGTLATKRSEKNKRDLDITLAFEFNGEHQKARTESLYLLR